MKFLILLICIIPTTILANNCGSNDCQCWAPCFNEFRSGQLKKEYGWIYQTIQTVRGAIKAYNVRETTFAFDGTASNSIVRQVQRNLASILAITTPVGTDCNSFYATQFFKKFAYSFSNWQCRSKCDIADFLQQFGYIGQTSTADWLGGGCVLGNYFNNLGLCNKGGGRLVVTFQNSEVYSFNPCLAYEVGVAVKLSGNPSSSTILSQIQNVNGNLELYEIDLPGGSGDLLQATKNVLSCVKNNCSNECQASGRKKRSILEAFGDRSLAQAYYTKLEFNGVVKPASAAQIADLLNQI